ncbi:hypothetical protein SAMN02745866_00793 [Alteromonadaceae bacterium Bs31]|nr:hypothetical protein SAMN02745866_00793 [Alteromonadaceae bacterium Bs31]
METTAISTFLFMGLALGLVHAFDPDHLAAVGGLSAGSAGHKALGSFQFALHWSVGHGSALFIIALLVFIFGQAIPTHLSELAESSVAFMLIAIGLLAFWRLSRRSKAANTSARYTAPLVGLVHGTAGSAGLLAIIPLSQIGQPALGLVYVLFFSAGVLVAMSALGSVFAHSMRMFQRADWPVLALIQGLMAAFSLILGLVLAFRLSI